MSTELTITCRLFIYSAATMLFFAPVGAATLYKCELKAGVEITADGNIGLLHDTLLKAMSPMTIDVVSGVVRSGEKQAVNRWRTVQQGGAKRDWILVRDRKIPGIHDDGAIRIRDWKVDLRKGVSTVVYYDLGSFVVGTCKRLD